MCFIYPILTRLQSLSIYIYVANRSIQVSMSSSCINSLFLIFSPLVKQTIGKKKKRSMSGVWVFKNGVVRLIENPANEQSSTIRRKVLLHIPTNEVITSYEALERRLMSLGWERYYDDPDLLQFHKHSSLDLISLPKEFNRFKSMHMYDIVVKNRETFRVIDV